MPFKKFDEYLNHKGKLTEKPVVSQIADYTGENPKSPPVSGKIKGIDAPPSKGSHAAYGPSAKAANFSKKEKGLGDSAALKWEVPGTKNNTEKKIPTWPNAKHTKKVNAKNGTTTWPRTKTEHFIDKTKDMNLAEFTQYMYQECGCSTDKKEEDDSLPMVTAYATGKFHPHPPEAMRYVAALAKANPRMMEMLIHHLKDEDGLGDMLGASLDHPESYDHLSELFGDEDDGPHRSNALARSMDNHYDDYLDSQESFEESVGPPFHGAQKDDEDDQESDPTRDQGGQDDDQDFDDDQDSPEGEEGNEMPPEEDSGEEHDELGPDEQGPPAPEEGDETSYDDMQEPESKGPRKLKKKFAHDHLIDAMSQHDHMREKMKSIAM